MKKTLSAAFVVAALTLTSACGGGGGSDRPSADDVAAQIKKSANGAVTDKQADCAAKAIVDSDLSDAAVKAVAAGDTKYKPSAQDTEAQGDIATSIGKCVTGAVPQPSAATPSPAS